MSLALIPTPTLLRLLRPWLLQVLSTAPLAVVLMALEDFFSQLDPSVPSLSLRALQHMCEVCAHGNKLEAIKLQWICSYPASGVIIHPSKERITPLM